MLSQLTSQGINIDPELAIGDDDFGFLSEVIKHWLTTRHQLYWLHKTANVLNKVPKAVQPRIKNASRYLDGGDTTISTYSLRTIRNTIWY
nr:hypothetical protein [Candidatus Enterovibrio escacola]